MRKLTNYKPLLSGVFAKLRKATAASPSDVCLTVYHRYDKAENQLDATINNLLIFKIAKDVSGNSLPIIWSARL
jgi:hypothetical protein